MWRYRSGGSQWLAIQLEQPGSPGATLPIPFDVSSGRSWSISINNYSSLVIPVVHLGVPRSADDHFNFDDSSGSLVRFLDSE
jgi:hypothetical protein